MLHCQQWHSQTQQVGRVQTGLLTALIEYLYMEYLNLFQSHWQDTANIWETLGPARPTLGYVIYCQNQLNLLNYIVSNYQKWH